MGVSVKNAHAVAPAVVMADRRIGARNNTQRLMDIPHKVQDELQRPQPFLRRCLPGLHGRCELTNNSAVLKYVFNRATNAIPWTFNDLNRRNKLMGIERMPNGRWMETAIEDETCPDCRGKGMTRGFAEQHPDSHSLQW
jgi:hypothetical protein